MKWIQQQLPEMKEEVLQKFICTHCKRQVIQKKLEIPIGPYKGEKVMANYGCICGDITLAEQSLQRKRALQRRKMKELFKTHSLMNKSLKKASFETYEPTSKALADVKHTLLNYTKEFHHQSRNILLVGAYGVGKSHLAASVSGRLLESGYSSLFISVPKLLTKIRQTYQNKTTYDEGDIFDLIEDVDLFVLDDVGAEYTKMRDEHDNWTQAKLFEIFDSRIGKPTIYTTNLPSHTLKKKVGGRNFSRMMENTNIIKMEGNDYRMKGMIVHE